MYAKFFIKAITHFRSLFNKFLTVEYLWDVFNVCMKESVYTLSQNNSGPDIDSSFYNKLIRKADMYISAAILPDFNLGSNSMWFANSFLQNDHTQTLKHLNIFQWKSKIDSQFQCWIKCQWNRLQCYINKNENSTLNVNYFGDYIYYILY